MSGKKWETGPGDLNLTQNGAFLLAIRKNIAPAETSDASRKIQIGRFKSVMFRVRYANESSRRIRNYFGEDLMKHLGGDTQPYAVCEGRARKILGISPTQIWCVSGTKRAPYAV